MLNLRFIRRFAAPTEGGNLGSGNVADYSGAQMKLSFRVYRVFFGFRSIQLDLHPFVNVRRTEMIGAEHRVFRGDSVFQYLHVGLMYVPRCAIDKC